MAFYGLIPLPRSYIDCVKEQITSISVMFATRICRNFVMSVHMHHSVNHWIDVDEICNLVVLIRTVDALKFALKWDESNRRFT
jgi:hypothetical protein